MSRSPYTIAREIDREIAELAIGAAAGQIPSHEIAERLASLAGTVRDLRRYLARRCEFDSNPISEGYTHD